MSLQFNTKTMKNVNKNLHISAIKAAFPHTLPIMAGFLFLGASYGVLMASRGFSWVYPALTSVFVFAGSLEFALANLLLGAFSPVEVIILALMINARHIFYGISMLTKYRGTGVKKLYLIFSMCDETFSVNYSALPPEGVDRGWFMFYISLLDHLYWIFGATVGGVFGSLMSTDIQGVDFAMTAMFVVILIEQIKGGMKNIPSVLVGAIASVIALIIFGAADFLIPAMLSILLSLALLRRPITSLCETAEEDKL